MSPALACAIASTMKNRGTQIPSFSPLSTFSPWRTREGRRGSVTTACPSAASVGARITARRSASGHESDPEQEEPDDEPDEQRQRQADTEQARRDGDFVPERSEVDPRRVAEEDERERRLGEQLDGLARDGRVDEAERVGSDERADAREHHRRGDRRSLEPAGDGREPEQRQRDDGQGPVHVQTLSPCRSTMFSRPDAAWKSSGFDHALAEAAGGGDRSRRPCRLRHRPIGMHRRVPRRPAACTLP